MSPNGGWYKSTPELTGIVPNQILMFRLHKAIDYVCIPFFLSQVCNNRKYKVKICTQIAVGTKKNLNLLVLHNLDFDFQA